MCGIVGIAGVMPVNQSIYDALTVLQHRGRLIRRPSVAIVRSPNTCATTVFRSLKFLMIPKPFVIPYLIL